MLKIERTGSPSLERLDNQREETTCSAGWGLEESRRQQLGARWAMEVRGEIRELGSPSFLHDEPHTDTSCLHVKVRRFSTHDGMFGVF